MLIDGYQKETLDNITLRFFGEMRDMTPEESEAHEKYLSSISQKTGVNIYDLVECNDNEIN